MPRQTNIAKLVAASSVMVALCWFSLVIADRWAKHELPTGGRGVVACLSGMAIVGSFVGFAFTALMDIFLRVVPAKFRWPLSSAAWLAVCFASYVWLVDTGADSARSATLATIAGFFGVFLGAPYADLFVTTWFLKRTKKVADAERDRTIAAIKREAAREQEKLQRQFAAERLVRLNEQERPQAIRNFMRS